MRGGRFSGAVLQAKFFKPHAASLWARQLNEEINLFPCFS